MSTFRQGLDEPLCEAWERFKMLLKRCPNHGFEDITQLSNFHNGLRPNTKMILNSSIKGTLMVMDSEQATRIIDVLALIDYQVQHDRKVG